MNTRLLRRAAASALSIGGLALAFAPVAGASAGVAQERGWVGPPIALGDVDGDGCTDVAVRAVPRSDPNAGPSAPPSGASSGAAIGPPAWDLLSGDDGASLGRIRATDLRSVQAATGGVIAGAAGGPTLVVGTVESVEESTVCEVAVLDLPSGARRSIHRLELPASLSASDPAASLELRQIVHLRSEIGRRSIVLLGGADRSGPAFALDHDHDRWSRIDSWRRAEDLAVFRLVLVADLDGDQVPDYAVAHRARWASTISTRTDPSGVVDVHSGATDELLSSLHPPSGAGLFPSSIDAADSGARWGVEGPVLAVGSRGTSAADGGVFIYGLSDAARVRSYRRRAIQSDSVRAAAGRAFPDRFGACVFLTGAGAGPALLTVDFDPFSGFPNDRNPILEDLAKLPPADDEWDLLQPYWRTAVPIRAGGSTVRLAATPRAWAENDARLILIDTRTCAIVARVDSRASAAPREGESSDPTRP